jgi:hypothetical protein
MALRGTGHPLGRGAAAYLEQLQAAWVELSRASAERWSIRCRRKPGCEGGDAGCGAAAVAPRCCSARLLHQEFRASRAAPGALSVLPTCPAGSGSQAPSTQRPCHAASFLRLLLIVGSKRCLQGQAPAKPLNCFPLYRSLQALACCSSNGCFPGWLQGQTPSDHTTLLLKYHPQNLKSDQPARPYC